MIMFELELVTGLNNHTSNLGVILTERRKKKSRVLVHLLKVFGEVIPDFKQYTCNVYMCVLHFIKNQPLLD